LKKGAELFSLIQIANNSSDSFFRSRDTCPAESGKTFGFGSKTRKTDVFSLAQAFYAWGNGDGILELSGPFYGPPASPVTRTPVNGRDIAMETAHLP
jgi:hypothetical protein